VTTLKNICSLTISSETFFDCHLAYKESYRREGFVGSDWRALRTTLYPSGPGSEQRTIPALSLTRITGFQIYQTLEKVEKIILNTPEGLEWSMSKAFTPEDHVKRAKKYGPAPGTLRIFAPDLACFFTGRNWRKIRICK
jgi:hypothetical protein